MKKIIIKSVIAIAGLLLLSSCSPNENKNFVVIKNEQTTAPAEVQNTIEAEPVSTDYNPLDEEHPGEIIDVTQEQDTTNADPLNEENVDANQIVSNVDSTIYPYAGSTPIPLLPADLPTPTPRKALEFTYQDYNANNLNLKFQAPTGWEVNESIQDTYILNEPAANQKDGYSASITIRAVAVTKEYTLPDLKKEVIQQLEQLGATNYDKWSPSLTAERPMLNAKGVYANYKGTLVTGVEVRGRIHATCIDKTLYSIHISQPANFNNDYITVFSKLLKSLTFIRK